MIPNHALSNPNRPAPYLYPDNSAPFTDLDWEYGGIALNDPSQGLLYQVWQLRLDEDTGDVFISAPNHPESLLFNQPDTSEISLAFDQNMNPFVAYVCLGQAGYWWFDPFTSQMEFVTMDPGVGSPKCCMDDKRALATADSDILLGYVEGGDLYYREQRDRFLVPYLLKVGVTGQVLQVGMARNLRVDFFVGVMA